MNLAPFKGPDFPELGGSDSPEPTLAADSVEGIRIFDTSEHATYTEEEPNTLDADEAQQFLNCMRDAYPQHYAMTCLGFATGPRPSSLRPLRRKGATPDVLWDEGALLVRRSHTIGAGAVVSTTRRASRFGRASNGRRDYSVSLMKDDVRIEHRLVQDGTLFEEIDIVETKIEPTVGNEDWSVTIKFRVEKDLLESCAFGLIYVLRLLSFHDGRPRGISGKWFEDNDEFTAADMLRHLKFERGTLKMYVDYLRGRCVKTDVELSSDGRVFLKTVNRGQAATRWVERLKGKRFLRAVDA